ncbi:MAG: hypothetical protein V3S17_04895, partial [candidate division Zixibacteria bacterium]
MIQQCNYKLIFAILVLAFSFSGCDSTEREINSSGAGDTWVFTKVSGDNQSTVRLATLPQPLIVQLKRLNGTPLTDKNIRFSLIYGNGAVQRPVAGSDYFELVTFTNFEGKASAQFLNYGGDSLGVSRVSAEVMSEPS